MIGGTVGYGMGLREGAMASSRSSEGVCEVAVFLDSIIRSTRPYGIFVNLFVFTPAPCEQKDFLLDESVVSYLPTEDIAVLSRMIAYRLIEISQSLS